MKISKRVGRMALDALGAAPIKWAHPLWDTADALGWGWGGLEEAIFRPFRTRSAHSDTLLCLIASIAEVE